MGLLDVWIYDSTKRIKVFLCYLLIFVVFFIFTDIMVYVYTKSMYKNIENYQIVENMPINVSVNEAIASNVNGSIKGTIKNTSEELIKEGYLKFDFYTPRNVNVGTKYIEINYLNPNEERNYEMGFKYDNITSFKVELVSKEVVEKATPEELKNNPIYGPAGLISGIILGYFFL